MLGTVAIALAEAALLMPDPADATTLNVYAVPFTKFVAFTWVKEQVSTATFWQPVATEPVDV